MKPTKRSLEDGECASGSVNYVTRSGESVLRPMGHWFESVHELLVFLEDSGFSYSPQFQGIDKDSDRERLSYIDGEIALRPWPEVLCTLAGLEQIADMLKKYHDVISSFRPVANNWHLADRQKPSDYIIRHGDLGPWNMVWKDGRLVGVIDWDFAEPGLKIEDVAQAAWHCIPLKPSRRTLQTGISPDEQDKRLAHFCGAYGVPTQAVLRQVQSIQALEIKRMRTHGVAGVEPWASFLNRGDVDAVEEDAAWLLSRIDGQP